MSPLNPVTRAVRRALLTALAGTASLGVQAQAFVSSAAPTRSTWSVRIAAVVPPRDTNEAPKFRAALPR